MSKQLALWAGRVGDKYWARHSLACDTPESRIGGLTAPLKAAGAPREIVEIMCGCGANLLALRSMLGSAKPTHLAGVDVNKSAIVMGRKAGADITVGSGLDLHFDDDSFDLAFTMGGLTHMTDGDMTKTVKEMYRVARKYILVMEYFSSDVETKEYAGIPWRWERPYQQVMQRTVDAGMLAKGIMPVKAKGLCYMWWLFGIKKQRPKSTGKETKFAFCDRGDWRIQMYMPLMQELAERGHDVVVFPALWAGANLPKPLGLYMRVCAKAGVRPVVQSAATEEYILITDQDFTRKMARHTVGKTQLSLPLISFGYFTTGSTMKKRPPLPVGSMLIGDYVVEYERGGYYFKNWSFTKHAVNRITQAEARRRLGLPLNRKILAIFTEPRCQEEEQILAIRAVAARYKKQGYLIVLRTKNQALKIPCADVFISTLKSNRPMSVALEVCRAADVAYSYLYHGVSNIIRGTGIPYIMEPNPEAMLKYGGARVRCTALKSLIPPGYITPDEPLEAFEGRSLAPKLNHTYEQFMKKVSIWRKECGR